MGIVNVKLLDKDKLVARRMIGTGKVNDIKFEFGITATGKGYVEYRGRIVTVDNESFIVEAVGIINTVEE